jgi:hypothetical protein
MNEGPKQKGWPVSSALDEIRRGLRGDVHHAVRALADGFGDRVRRADVEGFHRRVL